MKKAFVMGLVFMILLLMFPIEAQAAGASFSISGPGTLQNGEVGTYTVKVSVSDAAAAQATLQYDGSFFELVSGNPTGEWDSSANESKTVELTTVSLKCIGGPGTSGSLSLSNRKASRLTGADPPSESVSCSGGSKTVSNPAPTPTPTPTAPPPTPTPAPSRTPAPGRTPAPTPRHTVTPKPSAVESPVLTPELSSTPVQELSATPVPTPTPEPWTLAAEDIDKAKPGESVSVRPADTTVPASVLALLKERGCVLRIELDGYACTIDGRGLCADSQEAIDLGLSMEKDGALSAVAGRQDLFQLHFSNSEERPGRFVYTFKAKGCKPGDVLYLYDYYERAGVAECVQSAAVDADGNVTFVIYRGSGYFVTETVMNGSVFAGIKDSVVQAGISQVQPDISVPLLVGCTAGGALLGAAITILLVRWAVKHRKARG